MQTLVMLLLIAMFSLSLWAAPSSRIECELAALTGYDQLIKMLVREQLITPLELKDLLEQSGPTDPYAKREKNEFNHAIRQSIKREMRRSEARENWPATQKMIGRLLQASLKGAVQVSDAKASTQAIFIPKLYDKIALGLGRDAQYLFNPLRDELVAWANDVQTSFALVYNLKNKTKTWFTIPAEIRSVVVGHDGEIWIATADEDSIVKVRTLKNKRPRYLDSSIHDPKLTLFETPQGEMLIATTSGSYLKVFNVTSRKEILLERKTADYPAKFVAHENGTTSMAVAIYRGYEVYRLEGDQMKLVGHVPLGEGFSGTLMELTADSDGHPVIVKLRGETQQVIKIKDGQSFSMRDLSAQQLDPNSVLLRSNSKKDLILVAASHPELNELNIINLSDKTVPAQNLKIPHALDTAPAWFELPDGQAVFALSFVGQKSQIISANGSELATLNSMGQKTRRPSWWRAPNGNIFLAIGVDDEVHIYSVWNEDL